MTKHRHIFHLIDGEAVEVMSESAGLCHITFGNETAFYVEAGDVTYTIPFFSVSYIETEECEVGGFYE